MSGSGAKQRNLIKLPRGDRVKRFVLATRIAAWDRVIAHNVESLRYIMIIRHEMEIVRAALLPRVEGRTLSKADVRYYARSCIDTIRFYRRQITIWAPLIGQISDSKH